MKFGWGWKVKRAMQKPSSSSPVGQNRPWTVPVILFASLVLRWILVLRGGQYYFSDEGRYETSRTLINLLLAGKFSSAFAQLVTAPEHLGFKILGIIPSLLEQLTRESLVIPALFFSLFSVFTLYLIYKIAQRAGATERESLFALLFAACSMSLLYFSRHLVPYDTAMTFGLLAVFIALTERPSPKTSLLCGASAFLCFITYNGYWSLAGLGMLIHIFRNNSMAGEWVRKASLAAVGFALPAILLFLLALLAGTNLLAEYRVFSTTVSQGSFEEGWSLPFEYFWRAEHWLFVAWIALSILAVAQAVKRRDNSSLLWAGCIAFLYACLVIPSVYLHSFVVYGRLARQMLPFLLLLSASGLGHLEQNFSFGGKLARAVMLIVILQAAWNYKASFGLSYPRDFAWEAQTLQPDFHFSEKRLIFGAPTLCQNNGFVIENVKRFEAPPEPTPVIEGKLLLSALHPDNFLPYQLEGYTPEQRQIFHERQPEMRFYKAEDEFMSESNPVWTTMKNCVVKE